MISKRAIKKTVIGTGFAALQATRLHRAMAQLTSGQGAILMLHHVRPSRGEAFAPNRTLEIEPAFLDAAIGLVKRRGFDLVSMDEAVRRIGRPGPRFVALTFDDGYKDCRDRALPILERHDAPFALYVTTGFADRTARLWWVELEDAIRALDRVDIDVADTRYSLPCGDAAEKSLAFETLYWALRRQSEAMLLDTIGLLMRQAGLAGNAIPERLCLDWDGIRAMAHHPLCTIGVHTLTHPRLALQCTASAREELAASRERIETEIGLPARHLAYPIGDLTAAGPRDYALASDLGFESAITTRPGMLFPGQRAHMMSLPRLSVNGNWQSLASLDVLLSGLPFAIWNRGRYVIR